MQSHPQGRGILLLVCALLLFPAACDYVTGFEPAPARPRRDFVPIRVGTLGRYSDDWDHDWIRVRVNKEAHIGFTVRGYRESTVEWIGPGLSNPEIIDPIEDEGRDVPKGDVVSDGLYPEARRVISHLAWLEYYQRGRSKEDVVVLLRCDARAPWQGARHLLLVCAAWEHRFHRVYFDVSDEAEERHGPLAAFLPMAERPDFHGYPYRFDNPLLRLKGDGLVVSLSGEKGAPWDERGFYGEVRKQVDLRSDRCVILEADDRVPCGVVIRAFDLLLRAGVPGSGDLGSDTVRQDPAIRTMHAACAAGRPDPTMGRRPAGPRRRGPARGHGRGLAPAARLLAPLPEARMKRAAVFLSFIAAVAGCVVLVTQWSRVVSEYTWFMCSTELWDHDDFRNHRTRKARSEIWESPPSLTRDLERTGLLSTELTILGIVLIGGLVGAAVRKRGGLSSASTLCFRIAVLGTVLGTGAAAMAFRDGLEAMNNSPWPATFWDFYPAISVTPAAIRVTCFFAAAGLCAAICCRVVALIGTLCARGETG